MTEIPEHLLKRSRERRAAMGGGDDASGGGDAPAAGGSDAGSATPAKAAATTPAMPAHEPPAVAEPPKPPSPMVQAYQRRRKIPFWALPVLAALPFWAYVYHGTLSPPPAGAGPAVLGAEAFSANGCAGCHGAGGGGGVGPAFTNGSIYQTWPKFEDHFKWVRLGSAGWAAQEGDTYGANNKPIGSGGMPGFSADSLSDADLVFIILHEREDLGGEDPNANDKARLEMTANLLFDNPSMSFEDALAQVDAAIPPEG